MNSIHSDHIPALRKHLAASALIILLIVLVYANTLDNEFTNWDDDALILNNTRIRSLDPAGIKTIFDLSAGGTYQPMRVLSYAIDYYIDGYNPRVFVVHNILLHMAASVLLYFFLVKLLPQLHWETARKLDPGGSGLHDIASCQKIALVASLLFAVHPVNVEAVTWLSSRKYVLLAFFSFLSLLLFIQEPKDKKARVFSNAASFICWLLAVMSSPFGVILPALFILIAYCRYPHANPWRFVRDTVYRFVPYLVLLVGVVGYLLSKQRIGSRQVDLGTGVDIFFSMMQVFFDYLRNFLFPFWLNNRYVDYIYVSFFEYYKVAAGFVLLAILIAIAVTRVVRSNDKRFFFVLFWFLVCWLPAANIIPISTRMADRYVYLASVGFFVGLSSVVFFAGDRIGSWIRPSPGVRSRVTTSMVSIMLIFFAVMAVQRNQVWQNSGTLWGDSLQKDSRNYLAHQNYANWLFSKGRVELAKKHLLMGIQLKPDDPDLLLTLGQLYLMQKAFEKAQPVYRQILTIDPHNIMAHRAMVEILYQTGRRKEAEPHIEAVLSDKRDTPTVLVQKGLLYYEKKEYARAADFFGKALRAYPQDPDLLYNFALNLQALKSHDKARVYFSKAIDIKPDFALAHDRTGQIYFAQKAYDLAMKEYNKALDINSGMAEIHNDMGNVFLAQHRYGLAADAYETAERLAPDMFEPRFNQCLVTEKQAEISDAMACYQQLITAFPDRPEPLNNAGSLWMNMGELQPALSLFNRAADVDPLYLPARYNLARLFIRIQEPAQALTHIGTMIAAKTRKSLNGAGELCARLADEGYSGTAEKCFQQLLDQDPNRPEDLFKLGIIHLKRGDRSAAAALMEQAYHMDPDNAFFKPFLEPADDN
jgi:protein O-mannosyl-transferase